MRALIIITALLASGCIDEYSIPKQEAIGIVAGKGALLDPGVGSSLNCRVPVRLDGDDRIVSVRMGPWACEQSWEGTKVLIKREQYSENSFSDWWAE